MPIPITVPRLGWSMEEGQFAGWLKQPGEAVRPGDPLFNLESEKATEPVESLDAGVLHVPENGPAVGDTVAVGVVIGYLLQPGESPPQANPESPSQKSPGSSAQPGPDLSFRESPEARESQPAARHRISPRARRAARELGIDPTTLTGRGTSGRVRERDVRAAGLRTPTIRRIIAQRMLASAQQTAAVTLTTTADASALVRARKLRGGDLTPSYTDLFVKLCSEALTDHPRLNAWWQDDRLLIQPAVHIGIAVDTEAGLVVPVIREVHGLDVVQIAQRSRELIERARSGRLKAEELQGGTFTITNLGAFGIDSFTPIINQPQVAILGIGRISEQAVVRGGAIVVRPMVTLSLTFDHRAIDGAPAARFLQTLVHLIEAG